MENDKIKYLLDKKPVINRKHNSIISDISYKEIMENTDDKNVYSTISQLTKYNRTNSNTRCSIEDYNFTISESLYKLLTDNYKVPHAISRVFKGEWYEDDKNRNIYRLIYERFNNLRESGGGLLYYGTNQKIKFGRFIRSIVDIIYSNDDIGYRNTITERFVNTYKSHYQLNDNKVTVLNGKHLLKGYRRKYHTGKPGMLRGSCMNNKTLYLQLYKKNKNKIFLFVMTDTKGKIVSRNLVWYIEEYDNYYFDRIYAENDIVNRAVLNFARKQSYMTYEYDGRIKIISNNNHEKDGTYEPLKVKLNFFGVWRYPYMDTFKYQKKGISEVFSYYTTEKLYADRSFTSTSGNRCNTT